MTLYIDTNDTGTLDGTDTVLQVDGVFDLSENDILPGTFVPILGSRFDNMLTGKADSDIIFAMGGQDSVNGGDSADTIYGGAGHDRLDGGFGADQIFGGTGDDT